MMKFQMFDRRSGETIDLKPCICHFGLTEILIPVIASLATSAGVGAATAGTIASIAAPALVGAGLGAGSSAIFGGDPGQGALFGGIGGALGLGGSGSGGGGILGKLLGGAGSSAAQNWAGSTMDDGTVLGGAGANGLTQSTMDDGSIVNMPSAPSGGQGALQSASGTHGLGLPTTLAILAAAAQGAGRPGANNPTAPQPPGFNTPWNPNQGGAQTRTPVNPYASNPYYTYGQGPEQTFFNNNRLSFGQPNMARGGALRTAIEGGKYRAAGGGALGQFSTGGGQNYVNGGTGGQDDDVDAKLSNGEYVFDAGSVSRLGDGNNEAGAKKLDEMRRAIANDAGSKHVVQNKTRPALSYLQAVA